MAVSTVCLVAFWEASSWVIDSRKAGLLARLIYFLIYFLFSPSYMIAPTLYGLVYVVEEIQSPDSRPEPFWSYFSGSRRRWGRQRFELDVSQVSLYPEYDERTVPPLCPRVHEAELVARYP